MACNIHCRHFWSGRIARELERVAAHVGELDDLVALVVVTEDEGALAEGGARRTGPFDQVRIAGRGERTGALDAAFREEVATLAEQEQGGRRRFVERAGGG